MRLRSPSQMRVLPGEVVPADVAAADLLAPLARAVHHSHCPACGADVIGVKDTGEGDRTHVQITCFGDPAHVFFFDTATGHISGQPELLGSIGEAR